MNITKEQAREIYNHYSQIEDTTKSISILRRALDTERTKEPKGGIIRDKYSFSGSIKLEIPTRLVNAEYNGDSCTIFNISIGDAILVLENHVVRLQKELEDLMKDKE